MTSQGPAEGTGSRPGMGSTAAGSQRPSDNLIKMQSATGSLISTGGEQSAPKKRRNHRAGKRKKGRRQSFLPATGEDDGGTEEGDRQDEASGSTAARPPFYSLGPSGGRNFSETSLASEALLDHRYVPSPFLRARIFVLTGAMQKSSTRQTEAGQPHRTESICATVKSRSTRSIPEWPSKFSRRSSQTTSLQPWPRLF